MFKLRGFLAIVGLFLAYGSGFSAAAEESISEPDASLASTAGEMRLAQEANRISADLGQQKFLVPYVVTPDGPKKFELSVAPYVEHVISLWFATEQGTIVIELFDPDGQLLASWREPRGEWKFEQKLAPGKSGTYLISVQAIDGARVHGVIGVKGPIVERCPIDNARMIDQPADPPHYWWPYLLIRPLRLAADTPVPMHPGALLVMPNNTGFESEDGALLRASAICELRFGESTGPVTIADSLGAPLLVPLFPRPERLYLQALTRASLRKNVKLKFNRVDKQLIAMIDDARAKLTAMDGPPVQERVLMVGFSASGVFTNRFAVLHPERVLAAAVGGPGGWPLAPVRSDHGVALPYPVGVADLDSEDLGGKPVDLAALKRVRFLFLLGTADTNDSVPCTDSFSDSEARLINRLYGTVGFRCGEDAEPVVKRWWPARRLYHAAGLDAHFRLYPDVRHEMGMTPAMWNDVLDMFRGAPGAN